jgi:hypothetical protein
MSSHPRVRVLFSALFVLALTAPAALPAQQTGPLPADYVPEFGTMWTFDAPPLDYWRARYGFTPDQAWLDNVRLSAVRLPGCSASFVSADGLVMTNHHCIRSCVTAISPEATDYHRTGFIAANRGAELRCPNTYLDQLQSIEDVTARVRARVTATAPAEQVAQRDAALRVVQEECTQQTGLICQVVSFYQGGMYSLYRYRRFEDVRMSMVPEEAVAFFGGDPDNFTYPRYALDMAFLRVYVDGRPYRPTNFLRWSAAGATDGEPVFVIGNPGSTGRLLTLSQMEYLRDVQYPAQLAQLERTLATLNTIAARSEADQRRLQNAIFSARNSHKAFSGYLTGLRDPDIMARKVAFEQDFRGRIDADPTLRARFGDAWDVIARAQQELASFAPQARYYGLTGSTLLNYALGLVRMPLQTALDDTLRLPAYRDPALSNLRRQLLGTAAIDREQERLMLAGWLAAAQEEIGLEDPLVATLLAGRTPAAAAEALIGGTALIDPQARQALLEGGTAAIAVSTDPLIVAVRQLEPASREVAERMNRLNVTTSAAAERVGQAIFAAYGQSLPPDATFTLRISDGVVRGYPMNGTIAPYKTSVYGLYARSTEFGGVHPFALPERWQQRRANVDMATPFNFVSTNDIIGGNSGSPVINRNGEVVGLIFDGNIEQLPTRFIFTDLAARSVSVHSRIMTHSLRTVYNAAHLADEIEGRTTRR